MEMPYGKAHHSMGENTQVLHPCRSLYELEAALQARSLGSLASQRLLPEHFYSLWDGPSCEHQLLDL